MSMVKLTSALSERATQEHIVHALVGVGYRAVPERAMNDLRRGRLSETLVEPLLIEGLVAINDGLTEGQAGTVAAALRRLPGDEEFLRALRDGVTVQFAPDEAARTIRLIDLEHPDRNVLTVTDEFAVKTGSGRDPRIDIVCLVNGLPLALIETKGPTKDWSAAAGDFVSYWEDAPDLVRFSALAVSVTDHRFRVAPAGTSRLTGWAEWKDAYPLHVEEPDDELEIGLMGTLTPTNLLDLAAHFIVFETAAGRVTKKLARYQQFRAANKIVARVLEGELDRGLIWHTQGSGKSLTMVFAARKLGMVGLNRPTIFIVIDRVDLDTQMSGTLTACRFPGVSQAFRRVELDRLIAADTRGVIVTTVQKFSAKTPALTGRDNVIVFVDEAHRTQNGELAIRMRAALPGASFFGFTGTPIEKDNRSTWEAFSPRLGDRYERYLDAYTIREAIADGATVEIRYERRLPEWRSGGERVDAAFAELTAGVSDEARERLKRDAARLAVVMTSPARVASVAEDVAGYVSEQLRVSGMKAQLVSSDRPTCAAYARALSEHLAPEEFAVVFTPDTKRDRADLRRWWAAEQWGAVHGRGQELPDADGLPALELGAGAEGQLLLGEAAARKALIEQFKRPESPLRLLIVCDMLLTGFDAPVEQVMFLDKPLAGHALLQAIARTNRPYEGKDRGLVVDYWGVFDRLTEALADFEPRDVEAAAFDLDELLEVFPQKVAEALAIVAGMPAELEQPGRSLWLARRLSQDGRAEEFERRFAAAQSLFESIGARAEVAPYLDDYKRLVELRAIWRRRQTRDPLEERADNEFKDLRAHTRQLIAEAVDIEALRRDLPVYRIDEHYLARVRDLPLDPEATAAEIDSAVEYEIKARGDDDPLMRGISERLEELRLRWERAEIEGEQLLAEYAALAEEVAGATGAHRRLGITARAFRIYTLAGEAAPAATAAETLVQLAARADRIIVERGSFAGWEAREDVLRAIRIDLVKLLAAPTYRDLGLLSGDFLEEVVRAASVRDDDAA
jgi:type I restriction enzyme, R subunit